MEAAWKLDDALFPYARFAVEQLDFNPSGFRID